MVNKLLSSRPYGLAINSQPFSIPGNYYNNSNNWIIKYYKKHSTFFEDHINIDNDKIYSCSKLENSENENNIDLSKKTKKYSNSRFKSFMRLLRKKWKK